MEKTRLSRTTLAMLQQFDSPTISNSIEHFEVRDPVTGYANMELKCQFPEQKPMVGYAVTCTADTTTAGCKRRMRLDKLLDIVNEAPKPLVLVVKFVGPDRKRSCFAGDMFCTAMQRLGVVGLVTDMGNRDLRQINKRTPEFHVFCPGTVVSHGHGYFIDFNVTVSVCGMTIRPGDLLHGDASGLVSVPLDIAEAVAAQAASTRQAEADYFDFLENNFSFEELKKRLGRATDQERT